MTSKIHPNLQHLAVDINTLVPLPGNPRRGDVDAIATSYDEFGQVKPIVVRPNDDGTATVLAGNHQLEAAKALGWDEIAVVQMEADEQKSLVFALADNKISELGDNDVQLLNKMLSEINDDYYEVLDMFGWDEFELASIDATVLGYEQHLENGGSGYVPPEIVNPEPERPVQPQRPEREVQPASPEARRVEAPEGMDQNDAITRGATASGSGGAKAVVQYNLVFDDPDQQRRWYDFLRWLRADAGTEGDTTAERLVYFLESHVDF